MELCTGTNPGLTSCLEAAGSTGVEVNTAGSAFSLRPGEPHVSGEQRRPPPDSITAAHTVLAENRDSVCFGSMAETAVIWRILMSHHEYGSEEIGKKGMLRREGGSQENRRSARLLGTSTQKGPFPTPGNFSTGLP